MTEEVYDKYGRMAYHPEFHFAHRQPFTESDLEYLCKYYESDGASSIGMALGKTQKTITAKVKYLREKQLFEYYKNLNKHW